MTPSKEPLRTVYDTILMFGKSGWKRVDWERTFAPGALRKTVEKRLTRMDKFCEKWGIELRKWKLSTPSSQEGKDDGRTRPVTYRQFTSASKQRVDYLLGPVLQESNTPQQNILRPGLGLTASDLQESFSGSVRHPELGQEA